MCLATIRLCHWHEAHSGIRNLQSCPPGKTIGFPNKTGLFRPNPPIVSSFPAYIEKVCMGWNGSEARRADVFVATRTERRKSSGGSAICEERHLLAIGCRRRLVFIGFVRFYKYASPYGLSVCGVADNGVFGFVYFACFVVNLVS
jgi:hypothetical protein